ncbi:MAG: DMT family protein [Muribaculaceae bacterium]|nr:DMT family protein [Muribaculaceae bacterium]
MISSLISTAISPAILTIILLVISNVFMTFAWYGHLKLGQAGISTNWPLILVILFSWGIALLEYMCQVPANRIGFEGNGGPYSLMQLKVMQEVITLVVFVIFCSFAFQGFEIRWNHYLAFLLLIGAVYLVFMK